MRDDREIKNLTAVAGYVKKARFLLKGLPDRSINASVEHHLVTALALLEMQIRDPKA